MPLIPSTPEAEVEAENTEETLSWKKQKEKKLN